MNVSFVDSFQSEWIKKKRSLSSGIVVFGGFFTAAVIIVARLINHNGLATLYRSTAFWEQHWKSSWESMAIFLLPLGVILITSLTTQLEFKNNTWKLLHALPVRFSIVFFSKLSVILLTLLQFLFLFDLGIYLSAVIPALILPGVPYPRTPIPVGEFLRETVLYFIFCLPIAALQYLISLHFRNFLVPVGLGFLFWVGAISALSWHYGYLLPYTYSMYHYLRDSAKIAAPKANLVVLSLVYFALVTSVNFYLYSNKKEKA